MQVLAEVDERLRSENVSDLNEVLLQLTDLGFEYPENTELLWRIGKAHKCLSDISDDIAAKQDHISRGKHNLYENICSSLPKQYANLSLHLSVKNKANTSKTRRYRLSLDDVKNDVSFDVTFAYY